MFRDLLPFARESAALDCLARIRPDIAHALPDLPEDTNIHANRTAQPLVTAYTMTVWEALQDRLPQPVAALGYSLGELTAYAVAGAIGADGLVSLASRRAELMDVVAGQPQAMLALKGAQRAQADAIADLHALDVAIINASDHFVLGGGKDDISNAELYALSIRVPHVRRLDVSVASHTSTFAGAVTPLQEILEELLAGAPAFPVIAGIDADAVWTRDRAVETLSRQVAEPILWGNCIEQAIARGARLFLELGPGRALSKMIAESHPSIPVRSICDFRSPEGVAAWVAAQQSMH